MDYTCMFLYAIYGFTNFIFEPLLARIILYTYILIYNFIYLCYTLNRISTPDLRSLPELWYSAVRSAFVVSLWRLLTSVNTLSAAPKSLSFPFSRQRASAQVIRWYRANRDFKARDFTHWVYVGLIYCRVCDRNEWFDPKGQISKLKEELFMNYTKRKETYIVLTYIVRDVMVTTQNYLDVR